MPATPGVRPGPTRLAAPPRAGGAGPHAKPVASERQAAKRLLAKAKLKPDPEDL